MNQKVVNGNGAAQRHNEEKMNKQTRLKVYQKYNSRCAYCGKALEFKDMQVDHIKPRRYFLLTDKKIADHTENLNPSCGRCNHYKRSASVETFRRMLKTLHNRVRQQYICKVAEDYGIIEVKEWNGKFYFEKFEKEAI
jgi:5-methylcytosine-specific restriction endonuclease McrA